MEQAFTLTSRRAVERGGEHIDRVASRPGPDELVETLEIESWEGGLPEELSRFLDLEARKVDRLVIGRFLVCLLDRPLHGGRSSRVEGKMQVDRAKQPVLHLFV